MLSEKELALRELQEVCNMEKSSRFSAEMQAAVLKEKLQAQEPSKGTTGVAGCEGAV